MWGLGGLGNAGLPLDRAQSLQTFGGTGNTEGWTLDLWKPAVRLSQGGLLRAVIELSDISPPAETGRGGACT